MVVLTMTTVLASCGGPVPSPSTVALGTAAAPSDDRAPIMGAADAFVVTLGQDGDGTISNDLRVEAVSPNGIRRPIATVTDLTAGLADGTRIVTSDPILVSARGHLTVAIEGHLDGVAREVVRRLIFDLHDVARPPLMVPAGEVAWSPDGRLAILDASHTTFVDPARGEQVVASHPDRVSLSPVWAADGSGLLGSRYGANDLPIPGIFAPDGGFNDGLKTPHSTTGVGRPYGPGGNVVGDAWAEGEAGTDHAITELRPGQRQPLTWITVHAPGPDPSIIDHAWDAAGTGQWIVFGRDGKATVVHLEGPGEPEERASFAIVEEAEIVGVAPDDAVIVAIPGSETAAAGLVRIETSTGQVIRIGRADGLSSFAGWAAAP